MGFFIGEFSGPCTARDVADFGTVQNHVGGAGVVGQVEADGVCGQRRFSRVPILNGDIGVGTEYRFDFVGQFFSDGLQRVGPQIFGDHVQRALQIHPFL
jgi:hypothetical protein